MQLLYCISIFFFFQAEDGIRDLTVTGVQTCALPISRGGDPLDTGVDLMAQHRGKRLQSVTLLSGGERALTGLALLFAIFYFRPSPFCVLDEVDAPLDDANIHRFLRVLRELASRTQFLVITPN